MKFKQTKIAVLLIFVLAMPSGVFAFLSNSGQTGQVLPINGVYKPSDGLVFSAASAGIKVVSAVQNFSIVNAGANTASLSFSCLSDGRNSGSLVQNSGVFNLNQPAQCFSLGIKGASVSTVRLSVQPLMAVTQKITVVVSSYFIASPRLLPAPVSQTLPILPTAFVYGAVLFIWADRKALKSKLSLGEEGRNKFKNVFSLEQLQVFRC